MIQYMLREFLVYDNFENMPKERYKNLLLQNKKVIDKINRLRERLSFDLYNAANNEYRRIINNFDIPFLRQLMYEQQIDFFEDDYNIKHNILLSKLINHNKMRNLIKLIILKKYSSFIKEDNSISGVIKGIINKLENIKIDEAIKIKLIKTFLYLSQKYDINLLGGKMMVGGAENNIYDNILIISVCFYFENDRDMILLCKNLIKKINSNDFSDNLLIKIDDVLASSYKHKILLSSPIVFDDLDYKNIIDEIFNSSDKINRQINDAILLVLTEEISILEQNPEICQPYGILFLLTSLIIEIINRGNLNINIFKKQPIEVLKELYSIVGVAINNTLSEEFIQGLKILLNIRDEITPDNILEANYIGIEIEQPEEQELTGVEPFVVKQPAVAQPAVPLSAASSVVAQPAAASSVIAQPAAASSSYPSVVQSKVPSKNLLSKIKSTVKYTIPLVLGIASSLWYNKLPISLSTAVSDISNVSSIASVESVANISSLANISNISTYPMMSIGANSPLVYTTNQPVVYNTSFPLSLTNSPVFGPELEPKPSEAAKHFANTLQHYLSLSNDLQSLFRYTDTYMVEWNNNTYNVGFIRLQTDGKGTNWPKLDKIPILFKPSKIVQHTAQIIEPEAVNTQIIFSSVDKTCSLPSADNKAIQIYNPQETVQETTCPYIFAPGKAVQVNRTSEESLGDDKGSIIRNFVLDTSNLISYTKNFTRLQEQSLNPEVILQNRFFELNVFINKEQINFNSFEKTSFNNDTYKTTLKFNDTEVIYFDKLDRTKDVITALDPSNLTTALGNISSVEQSSKFSPEFKSKPWMIELYNNTGEKILIRPTEDTGSLYNQDSNKTDTLNNPISQSRENVEQSQSRENVEQSQSRENVEQSQSREKEKPPRGCVEGRTPEGIITQNIVLCGKNMTPQQKELSNCLDDAILERDSNGYVVTKDKNGVRVVCTSYKKKYTKYYKKYLKYKTKYLKLEN